MVTVVAVQPQAECRQILNRAFVNDQRLIIVDKALGESDGTAEMMISDSSTISSLSAAWVDAVNSSGRFSGHSWGKKISVSLTTLDALIRDFGIPDFIKIDVEGFEFQVVSGLSQSVKVISLEFTPEFMDATFKCIDHFSQLGDIDLNYSLGESMQLCLGKWATSKEMTGILSQFRGNNKLFGDVYVRFTEGEGHPCLSEQT